MHHFWLYNMKLDTESKKKIKKKSKKMEKIMQGNVLFFNEKTRNWKNRKIEKIEFFRAFCVHTQKNLWDNSLVLCCSPKNFLWFSDTFLIFKILSQKKFSEKKARVPKFRKKKIEKWPIGRDMGPIFWRSILVY